MLGYLTLTLRSQNRNMQIRFRFDTHDFSAVLERNPTARDLLTMMPLSLLIEDHSTNEKIAYLPTKLNERGAAPFQGEAAGDLCYYAPWGTLVFYYDRYRFFPGLIRVGRLNGGIQPLLSRGKFPLAAELIT